MLRFISILLLLGGLAAAGLGGAALMERYFPKSEPPAVMGAPPPQTVESAPETVAPASGPVEAPPSVAEAPIAAPESAPLGDDSFNFQPMVEPGPESGPETAPESGPESGPEADAAPIARSMRSAPAPVDIDDPNVTTAVSESFIDTLKTVPVAHETPASAEYKRPFNVTFAINAAGGDSAVGALPGRGVIEEGTARVSDRVEVRLSGAGFQINSTSPAVQSLSPLTENTWRWSVTPVTTGDLDLTFEVFAIDADEVVPLRTFRDTVTVQVSGLNRAIAFADQANPLFVLLGGLGSLLAGLFGVARFFVKK